MNRSRSAVIAVSVALVIMVVSVWWTVVRVEHVEVDFTLTFTSGVGCAFQHPKLGLVASGADLTLRDSEGVKVTTVSMYKASSSNAKDCVMIGIATIPVKDVYQVYIDSSGTTMDAGFIDRSQVESGQVSIINP